MKEETQRAAPDTRDLKDLDEDPSAKFAYELATKPPMKDVASIKAASDIFDANRLDKGAASPTRPSKSGDRRR